MTFKKYPMRIDHFTLGASALSTGLDDFESQTGLRLPAGGFHPVMSTHNAIMSTGERQFMELIAIDPDAPQPERVRWFSLDDPHTKERLRARPRALCWVVETDDLDNLVANSPIDLGEIITLTRGDKRWRLTVPRNGSLPEGGLVPAFIQWEDDIASGKHPGETQPDLGARLTEITLTHPNDQWLTEIFDALGILHLAKIKQGARALSFTIKANDKTYLLD